MGFTSISVVLSIPTSPPRSGDALGAFEFSFGNTLELTGANTGTAGTLTLIRWFPHVGKWRLWLEDRPIQVPANSSFSGRYELASDQRDDYLLLGSSDGMTLAVEAEAKRYRGF